MKILILANSDKGLYNFRKELIEELIKEKHKVYISVPDGERIKDLKKMGCIHHIDTAIDRRGTNPLKDLVLIKKYNKILKEIKPDVVLTYTIKPNIYGGISCRIKKIRYIANITGLGTALENEGMLQKILIFMYNIALKKVSCCFAQNEENLNFLKKNITSTSKFDLLPGSGVNLNKFELMEYPNDEKIRFLFMGRIMKEKGIEQYLEAARIIKEKYKNTEFHILGAIEEKYKTRLKDMQEQGIVIYHGIQRDVRPFLKESSCLIHPSYYPEGMSNVLLEASASGRPIITTNRSGCRDIVENGKTGYIIEIKNSQQLIEKIEEFLELSNEQRKQMGIEARKKVEREFDRNIVINKYMKEIGK